MSGSNWWEKLKGCVIQTAIVPLNKKIWIRNAALHIIIGTDHGRILSKSRILYGQISHPNQNRYSFKMHEKLSFCKKKKNGGSMKNHRLGMQCNKIPHSSFHTIFQIVQNTWDMFEKNPFAVRILWLLWFLGHTKFILKGL